MQKKSTFFLFLFFIYASSAFSAPKDFRNGEEYMGSCWERAEILPYEKCEILHSIDGSSYSARTTSTAYMQFTKPSIGVLGTAAALPRIDADYFLTCWTGVNNFAFAIPIKLDHFKERGLSLSLMGNVLKFTFKNLDGKSLTQIRGAYSGFGIAIGALALGYRGGMPITNKESVSLEIKGWYAGLVGFFIGQHKLFLDLGKDKTQIYHPQDVVDFKDPNADGGKKSHTIAHLPEFKFQKIDYTSTCEDIKIKSTLVRQPMPQVQPLSMEQLLQTPANKPVHPPLETQSV